MFKIGMNDCEHDLSLLSIQDKYIRVPRHIYEDCLLEVDLVPQKEEKSFVYYFSTDFEKIQSYRQSAYYLCKWYPHLVSKRVPTSPSIIVPISDYKNIEFKKVYDELLKKFPFVRTCKASPKDVCDCFFSSTIYSIKMLEISNRTEMNCHVILRMKRDYLYECRCFYSKDKLRAVSIHSMTKRESESQKIEEKIIDFFNQHSIDLPFHSATIDLGFFKSLGNTQIEIIEMNSFGPDMKSGSGLFSWYEDVVQLLNGERVEFRYRDEFTWD